MWRSKRGKPDAPAAKRSIQVQALEVFMPGPLRSVRGRAKGQRIRVVEGKKVLFVAHVRTTRFNGKPRRLGVERVSYNLAMQRARRKL